MSEVLSQVETTNETKTFTGKSRFRTLVKDIA